jgi:phosphoglycerate dehydrogenase-like enzyme
MSKIVCMQSMSEPDLEQIRRIAPHWEIVHGTEAESWLPHLNEAEIVLGWRRTAEQECLKPGTRLRWVQTWGAGVDYVDFDKFAEYGVMLTNASGVHAYPISETILAMMLAFTRKVHLALRNQIQAEWQSVGLLGEIHGQTAGILGIGAIGEETAKLCKAFGMRVLGVRRSDQASPYVDEMVQYEGLDDVLRRSDFVINTLPLTAETRHIIGRGQFNRMQPTAFYINIGRGGTTDTEALVEALKSGGIAGAGLDVFEKEPLDETSPLWGLDNVILTPHNSGSTGKYQERAMEIFLHNLRDYVEGREPSRNRVDLQKQY